MEKSCRRVHDSVCEGKTYALEGHYDLGPVLILEIDLRRLYRGLLLPDFAPFHTCGNYVGPP